MHVFNTCVEEGNGGPNGEPVSGRGSQQHTLATTGGARGVPVHKSCMGLNVEMGPTTQHADAPRAGPPHVTRTGPAKESATTLGRQIH